MIWCGRVVGILLVVALLGCGPVVTLTPITPAPVVTLTPSTPAPVGTLPPSTPPPGTPPPEGDERTIVELIAATVQIGMYARNDAGVLEPIGRGSGTILSSDGLILTNAHVAGGDTPGLAVQYGDVSANDHVDELHISMNEAEDRPPIPRYIAQVVAIDGYLDLAVLQVASAIDGQPVSGLDLPFVPLGDSDAVRIGDGLTIVGYPGIGGTTISVDSDEVAGFLDDPKLGPRSWIKHGALQSGGNSGGLLADESGRIVGVPTKSEKELSAFGNARPIKLALPLIDAARTGGPYTPYQLVQLAGDERIEFQGWTAGEATGCEAGQLLTSYPSNATSLRPIFSWSGVSPGLDVMRLWVHNLGSEESLVVSRRLIEWDLDASGSCGWFSLSNSRGFEDGNYTLLVLAGPSLRQIARTEVTVGGTPGPGPGPGEGFELSGRIVDASTGLGIPNATVTVLKPGSDAQVFLDDPQAGSDLVVALGVTDANGVYTLDRRLAAGPYPWVLRASGYRTGVGTLTITGGGTISDVGLSPLGSP